MYTQNLHLHTAFCDGKDTPEELVLYAIEHGVQSLGFSGHSYMYFAPSRSMSLEGTEAYKKEILRLKEKYGDRLDIFCGLEMEMYSEVPLVGYDYLIGSCHYLDIDGKKVGFDRSAEEVGSVIDTYFDGNGLAYAVECYRQAALLPRHGSFDIIGHFDLVTKHAEKVPFFDTESPLYREAALDSLRTLASSIPLFEVNTGAIARGYRTSPYPAPFLVDECRRLGLGAVITSDCHAKEDLTCHFKESALYLEAHGFDSVYILTKEGFVPMKLKEFI